MKTTTEAKTANTYARAAIIAKFIPCTNYKPNRICVKTQRGRKIYAYENAAGDAGGSSAYNRAVAQYLSDIRVEDQKKHGGDCGGWGELSDYTVGVICSGEYVYTSNT